MYLNYIFDLYGTLADIHTKEEDTELWHKLALFYAYHGALYSSEELKESYEYITRKLTDDAVKEHMKKQNEQDSVYGYYPEIVIEEVFNKLFKQKGILAGTQTCKETAKFFRVLSLSYIKLYPHVEELLGKLKEKGKNVYLLSNAQAVFTNSEIDLLGIRSYFNGILLSSDAGCMKPDYRFYKKLIHTYQLNPKESIMIGNDPICDVEGAKEAGFDSFYIHSNLSPDTEESIESTYKIDHMDLKTVMELLNLK